MISLLAPDSGLGMLSNMLKLLILGITCISIHTEAKNEENVIDIHLNINLDGFDTGDDRSTEGIYSKSNFCKRYKMKFYSIIQRFIHTYGSRLSNKHFTTNLNFRPFFSLQVFLCS